MWDDDMWNSMMSDGDVVLCFVGKFMMGDD